jgi:hypothetical protein
VNAVHDAFARLAGPVAFQELDVDVAQGVDVGKAVGLLSRRKLARGVGKRGRGLTITIGLKLRHVKAASGQGD